MYQLFGCVGLIQINRLTFSKIKFESDPFSRVSSRCVIGVSLMSCCWLDIELNVHESRCDKSKRHNITGCGVFFGTEVIRFCLIHLESCGKFKP